MPTFNCMLAKRYEGQDPTGWWLSEKLDGVRAIWTGSELISRNNKPIHAPNWFLAKLPNKRLDGELFIARGMFQKTVSVVRKKSPIDGEWFPVRYKIIDTPDETFTQNEQDPNLDWILQSNCSNQEEMETLYRLTLERGGEGLMLRAKNSPYEYKRSGFLLKLKPELTGIATVLSHQPGEGKHQGRLGALVCVWQGKEFKIGTGFTDRQRENPPKVGDLVNFKYQCLTNDGIPRFPSF